MERNSKTYKLVVIAFFIALEIVLTRFCSINTAFLRIGFGFLPVAMVAIMFGPIYSSIAYAVGDILGMLIFPTGGGYFPGFTLTAFLTGLVFGIVLHGTQITPKRTLIASLIVVLVLNLGLDTLWLTILMGQGYLALLPMRLIKCAFAIPVQTFLIPVVWNKIIKKVDLA